MGQYQQWLSAQEVERRLKVERETLETELLYLQDRIAILEQSVPEAENMILQALQAYLQVQTGDGLLNRAQAEETVRRLPTMSSQAESSADMLAFFDRHEQTDPALAAWSPLEGEERHLLDAETRRLNENIRRWFIRWHRQISSAEHVEEVRNE